jgi:hypothetical protein
MLGVKNRYFARGLMYKNYKTIFNYRWNVMKTICNIEIIKDGRCFVARIQLYDGTKKEYRDENLENVFTQLVIELQDELGD